MIAQNIYEQAKSLKTTYKNNTNLRFKFRVDHKIGFGKIYLPKSNTDPSKSLPIYDSIKVAPKAALNKIPSAYGLCPCHSNIQNPFQIFLTSIIYF